VNGTTTIPFSAPENPGIYKVKASIPALSAESNVVELRVVERPGIKGGVQATAAVAAVASAVAIVWTLRAIRRR
jgi:hypothetical protein